MLTGVEKLRGALTLASFKLVGPHVQHIFAVDACPSANGAITAFHVGAIAVLAPEGQCSGTFSAHAAESDL